MAQLPQPEVEIIVSREAKRRYSLLAELVSPAGRLRERDLGSLRRLAQELTAARDVSQHPERAVSAGQLNGLGLLQGFLRALLRHYLEARNPEVLGQALGWLEQRFGDTALRRMLDSVVERFQVPGLEPEETAERPERAAIKPRERILEHALLLFVLNRNPAARPLRDLFADDDLDAATGYRAMLASLAEFFAAQPDLDGRNLFELLHEPALAAPDSLREQLSSILAKAEPFTGEPSAGDHGTGDQGSGEAPSDSMLVGISVLREEEKPIFSGPPGPPPPPELPTFAELELEEERYSADRSWMPDLVLMAKSCYVWLDQLSRAYGRPITRLDEIPDEELDRLQGWGITGLWLIGLWERSPASERIKRLCGNPEAAASAYSLYDSVIAARLGGEAAFEKLRDRAIARGIRLACDMVPNHTGVDSRWVVEHPDRFLSLREKPYPNYTFTGEDLCADERVSIRIEDHYYDKTDAAVVFERIDNASGEKLYIYHGNDGTRMPWNDTAQIDYLNPEAREAVIETILEVARRFPIIRFDAAMTLAKRHVHRLWYPEPGQGGDIPTRAEHGLSRREFDRRMPEEFWREVVDRVAEEVPDTLLLAEAFWLMEGYFVRTLGMHRVYNSAFMHMLRDEDNAKFRTALKQTLEFDPGILQRYVNFLTNPDEEPAVEQFGKGDKYFGICLMMVTLPGLPMFGHGQFEGFEEKYGMEYQRAYRNETPDGGFVARHEREIVPLLRRRSLFAEVENFRLFDFDSIEGHVAQDVIVFSNQQDDRHALVLYHNRMGSARGWIRSSVPFRDKTTGDLVRETLATALGVPAGDDVFCIYRDHLNGLEFLRSGTELAERGLWVGLGAYEHRVLHDFRHVRDSETGEYRRLARTPASSVAVRPAGGHGFCARRCHPAGVHRLRNPAQGHVREDRRAVLRRPQALDRDLPGQSDRQRRQDPAGRVIRILERKRTSLTGTLQRDKSYYYVVADDPRDGAAVGVGFVEVL
ncbi:MAG: alpha-amylase [Thermoanaerobaculia bacterium]|nr:alpha-amylase [Thermoanaerobaculia bacterium]